MKRLILILGLLTSFAYAQSKAGFYVVGGQLITVQDTSSRKYLKAVENAGVVPSVIQNFASNFLVTSERAIGSYSLIVAQYPFIGGTAATHKFNLNDPRDLDAAFRLVFYNSPTHNATGVLWNGTNQYANTFLTPSTTLSYTSTHLSYYTPTNSLSGTQVPIGSSSSTGSNQFLQLNFTSANYLSGDATSILAYTPVSTNGYTIGTRTAINSQSVFYKGVKIATTSISGNNNLSITSIFLGARSNDGTPLLFSTHTASLATIGAGLTDTQAIQQSQIVTSFNGFLSRQ